MRQAISWGIDYKGMIAALSGAAIASSGIVPAGLLGHFTDLPSYSYDPAKAKTLLNAAGYGPGQEGDEPVAHLHPGRHQRVRSSPP